MHFKLEKGLNLEEVCRDWQHRETKRDGCRHHNLGDILKYTCIAKANYQATQPDHVVNNQMHTD